MRGEAACRVQQYRLGIRRSFTRYIGCLVAHAASYADLADDCAPVQLHGQRAVA